jgi:hypothetical protein
MFYPFAEETMGIQGILFGAVNQECIAEHKQKLNIDSILRQFDFA